MRDIEITVDEVRKKLANLKANKASGPDGISVNVLRNCLNFDVPLKLLFENSLFTSNVPQDWRDANVSPLFKKRLTYEDNKLPSCIIDESGGKTT